MKGKCKQMHNKQFMVASMLRSWRILYKTPIDFATLDTINLLRLLNFNSLSKFRPKKINVWYVLNYLDQISAEDHHY